MTIDSDLAKSLFEKSDQELIGMLENPSDWRAEVVDFVRSELSRRSISPAQIDAQIDQQATKKAQQKAEEFQKHSNEPLSFWENFFTVLYGAGLGLLGLPFVWSQASRFKSHGYLLKSQRSWPLYWLAFGVRIAAVGLFVIVDIVSSR